ncbi:tRNA lysidine(34) synthetase TilS [Shewanella sedimentimangrovi]|uniref:tRNA(Ile)-lysidine synthase n=1 Tax=Shewanella sedimentimangrovi TaxID=2814293 RepID=A0ABX7R3L8_9GAMM|nr:tRNA lysidine(34) synthetase TilS [Shewanella sedimentimangrovi]QSX38319.1 tRNA lysidine(34) synthetase TilS [Shewanella sedimentimangrovi]
MPALMPALELSALAALIDSALGAIPRDEREPHRPKQPNQSKRPVRIVLGYSGGLDSELLACALGEFAKRHPAIQCIAAHVHHGLSPNADAWACHCQNRAAHYGLQFQELRVTLARDKGLSLEAEARDKRYQALLSLLGPGDVLLTAHHEDDQLETLLLALKRGQGPKGLAAMGLVQPLTLANSEDAAKRWQLRPFLGLSRSDMEQTVEALGLVHIEDESNSDTRFDRNFLRHEIIPLLKQRWPAFAQTSARSAALCASQQQLLDAEMRKRLEPMLQRDGSLRLCLTALAEQEPLWQEQLLRGFIELRGLPLPSQLQLQDALKQLLGAREDAAVHLRFQGLELRRFQGCAYALAPALPPVLADATVKCPSPVSVTFSALKQGIALADGRRLWLEPAAPGEPGLSDMAGDTELQIVFGLPGSTRTRPHHRDKGRELKKVWQELGVPPWERATVPMLILGQSVNTDISASGQLLAAAGLWLEKSALAKPGDTAWRLCLA